MKPRQPSPSSPPERGGAPDLAAGLLASIDRSAPEIAAELSALLQQSIQVTTIEGAIASDGGPEVPSQGRSRPAASVTIDFRGDVAGRGTLTFDQPSLSRLAGWLPAWTGPQVSRDRDPAEGFSSSRPPAGGLEPCPPEELSEPLLCCALLELGSVVLGYVLTALLQRSGPGVSFGLPRWHGATGPPPALARRDGLERPAVPLYLSSLRESAVVWLHLLVHDVRDRAGAVERGMMA